MQMQDLIAANQRTLKDAEHVLMSITDTEYSAVTFPFTASLAKHMRHITDHYQRLLDGLPEGIVDYDQRDRSALLESERSAMILLLRKIVHQLDALRDQEDSALQVKLCLNENMLSSPVPSTLSREMVFLQSHATHHYALISAMLKLAGIETVKDFGVAASTLVYERTQCAR